MGASAGLIAERVRLALDLAALGEATMRQKLRRMRPLESEGEIDARIAKWHQAPKDADWGDTVLRPVAWPRRG
jgi:hypothetical protein